MAETLGITLVDGVPKLGCCSACGGCPSTITVILTSTTYNGELFQGDLSGTYELDLITDCGDGYQIVLFGFVAITVMPDSPTGSPTWTIRIYDGGAGGDMTSTSPSTAPVDGAPPYEDYGAFVNVGTGNGEVAP